MISINVLGAQVSETCPTKTAGQPGRTIHYNMEDDMSISTAQAHAYDTRLINLSIRLMARISEVVVENGSSG
jgi:hypothetical protein